MKLRKLTLRGLIPFPQEVDVPIEALGDAQLVAVTGANGAGKSTMLEAIPGALYRTMPSRGLLSTVCNDAKSKVVVDLDVNGATITAEVRIDAVKGKTEAYLIGDNNGTHMRQRGPLAPPDGKVKTYVEAVARYFPPQDVYLASAFGAQSGAGRFLDLEPADRRALLAKLIGIERWQEIADAAGVKARVAKSELDTLKGKVAGLQATQGVSDEEMNAAFGMQVDALAQLKSAEAAHASQAALLDEWKTAAAEITAKLTAAQTEETHAEKAAKEIAERVAKLRTEHEGLEAKLAGRDALEAKAKQECEDPAAIEALIREELEAESKFAALKNVYDRAKTAREDAIHRAQTDLARSKEQSAMLETVECEGKFPACEFLQEAIEARDAIPSFTARLADNETLPIPPEPTPAPTKGPKVLEASLPGLRKKQKEIADAKTALAGMEQAGIRLDAVAAEISIDEGKYRVGLAAAGAAVANVVEIKEARDAKDAEKPTPADKDAVDAARTALQTKRGALTTLEERRRQAEEAEKALVETKAQIDTLTADLDDWTELQRACGPRGVQAYLIDASAPEISAITNDLLHDSYGSRYTVRLTTQAAAAKRGATKEVCDLTVLDNERGTDGSADLKSGGERVIIGEAFANAISLYNKRRSSIPMDDLFRDECVGALDKENARRYVDMMRRTIKIGGLHRIYFIAHDPDLWDLADARLHVEGGKVVAR